ncbi:MAG: right-handed parallel beta-helix repeat-containing protein [Lachnospiraceae bacterium]|nr:right-handed parallel beta-helix repeat-containing protein [Lachnospiraceae bacterium]
MKKIYVFMIALMLGMLTACGSGASETDAENATEETVEEQQEQENKSGGKSARPKKADADTEKATETKESAKDYDERLIGSWTLVCETDYSGNPGDDMEEMEPYFFMADEEGFSSTIDIYDDGGSLYADYSMSSYEYTSDGYHMPVTFEKTPLYDECKNQEWSAKITNARTNETVFQFTLTGDNQMMRYQKTDYDYDDGESWSNIFVATFLREGSDEMKHKDDMRYNDTVTVSDVSELLKAIQSNRKIILKEGTYDLSTANERLKNPDVQFNHGYSSESGTVASVTFTNLTNLRLEAEEGCKVELCITDPYEPVLTLDNCDYVSLIGLTLGHHVEPGTCSGSVLDVRNGLGLNVNNCHLYGCGTYGLEAYDFSRIRFEDTEIYECTYGIVDLADTYDAEFVNCNMHDNSDLEMITLSQCGSISFTDCSFKDNKVDFGGYATDFVSARDSYSITFSNCRFSGNSYGKFSEGDDVELENCSFKDTITSKKQ